MKIGGYGSIATSSAVAAVRKPNRRGVHIDTERVQDSAGGPARDAGSPFRGDFRRTFCNTLFTMSLRLHKDRSSHRDRPHVVLDSGQSEYATPLRGGLADTTKEWDRKDASSTRGGSTTSNSNRSRPTRGRTRSRCRTQEQTVNQLLDQELDQWDQWVRISCIRRLRSLESLHRGLEAPPPFLVR